jgi:hypothetical protein
MAVREFDTGDYVDLEMPAGIEPSVAWTVAAVFERRASGVAAALISAMNSSDEMVFACGVDDTNHPYVLTKTVTGFFVTVTMTFTVPEDTPCLLVFRVPGGLRTGVSMWDGATWTDELGDGENGAVGSSAGGKFRVGRIATATTDDWQGGITAVAYGKDIVPSDEQTHALAGGNNITWGDAILWSEIWEFQQAAWADPVPGLLGVSDSTAVVGDGTITCPDPPSSVYVPGVPWLQPPDLSAAPAIVGTVIPEQTVTCSTGAWRGIPSGYEYQWLLDGDPIDGETTNEYLLVNPDVAHLLSCEVTATNGFGATTESSAAIRVRPKPLLPAPATVLLASSRSAGNWAPRTVRYVNGDEWT